MKTERQVFQICCRDSKDYQLKGTVSKDKMCLLWQSAFTVSTSSLSIHILVLAVSVLNRLRLYHHSAMSIITLLQTASNKIFETLLRVAIL